MPGSLSPRVDASNVSEFSTFGSLGLDTKDRNRLVPPVGHNDESARFVHTHAAAGIHCRGKGVGDSADGLNQSECRTTLESIHVLSVLGSGMDLIQ